VLPPTRPLDQLSAWRALEAHAAEMAPRHLRELCAGEDRRERFSASACGLTLDYSRARAEERTLELLVALAEEAGLERWREALLAGAEVNATERRAALHVALRRSAEGPFPGPGNDVMGAVRAVRERMLVLAEEVRSGRWPGFAGEPVETVVNLGIGGSDLGPRLVCQALAASDPWARRVRFVANLDSTDLVETLAGLEPARTLFIVTSKSFTTQETLLNARSARAWLLAGGCPEASLGRHLVAVTSRPERAAELGIEPGHCLEMWDWVGGRYSLWSAVGLPIAVAIGARGFRALLAGAERMDRHFERAPLAANLPVLLALLGIWHARLTGAATHAVLPYDFALRALPAYLQQLEMESNGKRVTREGDPIGYPTCPIVWGGPANNGQHAFFQLLHQGRHPVPSDILCARESQHPLPGHQLAVLANALAQSEALARGRTLEEARAELEAAGMPPGEARRLAPHRVLPGNQPSHLILYRRLDPETLGALLALYEHKVFVQAVCWGVNPFDQWGVELGKEIAGRVLAALEGGAEERALDPVTRARVRRLRVAAG